MAATTSPTSSPTAAASTSFRAVTRSSRKKPRASRPGGRHLHENWKQIKHLQSQEITGEAGDFALLHHLMPHGASHNRNADQPGRLLRPLGARGPDLGRRSRSRQHGRYNTQQREAMGELGRKLFGVDDW